MIKNMFKKKIKFKDKGFTLAEILVTLTIIGIVAAILFPSILANYTERTLTAKRQALVARMNQAMAEMADTFAEYEDTDNPTANSSLKFVNEGLSKVYKISAVCDYTTLSSCDIPETITLLNGTTYDLIKNAKDIVTYSPMMSQQIMGNLHTWLYNVESAGFMTKNGESVLVFVYPRCTSKPVGYGAGVGTGYYGGHVTGVCANMIFDLNGGKQKPNRINEDIGFMTVFYSNMPYVVAPRIVTPTDTVVTAGTGTTSEVHKFNSVNYTTAKGQCAELGDNIKVTNYEELASIGINYSLYRDEKILPSSSWYWTSVQFMQNNTLYNKILEIDIAGDKLSGDGSAVPTASYPFICVQD